MLVKASSSSLLICVVLLSVFSGLASFPLAKAATPSSETTIPSAGRIITGNSIDVIVDFNSSLFVNNLSLGTQIAHDWISLTESSELQSRFSDARLKYVRLFVGTVQPCMFWNETSKTGIYDWTKFDFVMQTFQELNIQNIIISALGGPTKPPNMNLNYNGTSFPHPQSLANYCTDIAEHIKSKGWFVKYWEPFNEPYSVDQNVLVYQAFVACFNQAASSVLNILPYALFGTDISNYKWFLDRFVYDGKNVGFLSFHKYDGWGTWLVDSKGYLDDSRMLNMASTLAANSGFYTPQQMQQKWFAVTGVNLPVLCTETNMNSAWENGTDPRMQQPISAAWYAEELRAFALENVQASIFYQFGSNDTANWATNKQTKGLGFGMLDNFSPYTTWYPYSVNYLLGNHLSVGDTVCYSWSSNPEVVSTMAWVHGSSLNIMLVGKSEGFASAIVADLGGLNIIDKIAKVYRINGNASGIQISQIGVTAANRITINEEGYFVTLVTFE